MRSISVSERPEEEVIKYLVLTLFVSGGNLENTICINIPLQSLPLGARWIANLKEPSRRLSREN